MKSRQKLNLRRVGGIGMTTVIAILLICVFFSGTMRTLTTPKVRMATVSSGKLKDSVKLTGYLYFNETEEMFCPVMPEGVNATVEKVYVWKGQAVTQRTPLYTIRVTNIEELKTDLMTRWQANETQLLLRMRTPERTNRNDETWFAAYTDLMTAKETILNMEDGSPEHAAMEEQIAEAQAKFDSANRHPISDATFTRLSEMKDLRDQKVFLENRLAALQSVPEEITVAAPHDGIIVAVNINEGDEIDWKRASIVISSEEAEPVLRGNTELYDRQVVVGMKATVEARGDSVIRSSVTQTGYDRSGTPCIDLALKPEDMLRLSSAIELMNNGVQITITYSADETSLLIPVAALRGSTGDYYVYTINESEDVFGSKVLHLSRQPVVLIDQSDDMAAISGISPNMPIAYMEDRALADGAEVLIYGAVP